MPARTAASAAAAAGVRHPRGLQLREARRRPHRRRAPRASMSGEIPGSLIGRRGYRTRPAAPTARWRTASASRAAPGRGDVERLGARAPGGSSRARRRARRRARPAPAAEARRARRRAPARAGGVRSASHGGGAAARRRRPTTSKPVRASPGRPGATPSSSGQGEGGPHRRAHRARVEGVGRARAQREPVGARAPRRCAPACRRCPGRRRRPGRRRATAGSATSRKLRTGGWGRIADHARGRRRGCSLGQQLRRHAVALGQARGGGQAGVVVGHALGVHQQRDRPHAAREGGVDEVLALGHEQAPLAADLLGLERGDQPQRGVPRRADEPQPRAER